MTHYLQLFFSLLDLTGVLLLGLYLAQMVLAALLPTRSPRPPVSTDLNFTFIVPALNEALVIGTTVRHLRATAPEARVLVIDDASDDDTTGIVQALADHDPAISLRCRLAPRARQGKGQALNWAVRDLLTTLREEGADLSREIFVVVDADGQVMPDLLDEARAALADERVVGAQARVHIRPSGARLSVRTVLGRLLEQQQDMEFFIIWHVQRLRERWHSVGLFGNGQFMRASYLQGQFALGVPAWPDCLSEDFASGLEMRLAARSNRMAFLEAAVTQQGLPDLHRFTRQRARWTQGTMQCLGYLPRLWSSGVPWLARLDFTYFILSPWMNGLILLSLLTHPVRWALGAHGLILGPLASTLITVLNVGLQLQWLARYQRERRLRPLEALFTLASLPVYGFALFLSVPLAYWNHFSGRRTWDKSVRHLESGETLKTVNGE